MFKQDLDELIENSIIEGELCELSEWLSPPSELQTFHLHLVPVLYRRSDRKSDGS